MMILSFNRDQYFYQNLTNKHQLCAFALGAELPSVYTLIGNKRAMALSSLNEQNRLEAIAEQCYERFMEEPRLRSVLDGYADSILNSNTVMLHDVRLHAQYAGLPLAKYYSALKQTDGYWDRTTVWEKHLQLCEALSFALYEYYQDPRSDICYGEKTVIIDKPHDRQCYSYTAIKTSVSFQLDRYQYYQRPWPWED
ncbi:hypothetical protein [Vibrio coralliirubri]|uniref:hypothetical protein n=1 Tax=Vibrio coralliirubri TaxID=1516159 RepID=UPI000639307B|nr:hypothetical protein [Vibrio coralliirubri]CDS95222.1 hypothetical protein VCR1J2_100032 [Vibrio coralliirubri]